LVASLRPVTGADIRKLMDRTGCGRASAEATLKAPHAVQWLSDKHARAPTTDASESCVQDTRDFVVAVNRSRFVWTSSRCTMAVPNEAGPE
jgi:hypothetical protein